MGIKLPGIYIERMRKKLGGEFDRFYASYSEPPTRGFILNTLRASKEKFLEFFSKGLPEFIENPLSPNGFILSGDKSLLTQHPYYRAGLYYMQEPSAMSVAAKAYNRPYSRVLDLCAAPGGKSAGSAFSMRGNGVLVSNDCVFKRAQELKKNIERLGITNSVVTSLSPGDIAKAFPEYFELIIVDAPCSGEGMFRKDEQAIVEWSPEHVETCSKRQYLILNDAKCALSDGGRLVYSTCTFESLENELVVERFISENPEFKIISMEYLYPHMIRGEGHFVCVMEKDGDSVSQIPDIKRSPLLPYSSREYTDFTESCFDKLPTLPAYSFAANKRANCDAPVYLANDHVLEALAHLHSANMKALYFGIYAGNVSKSRFIPEHSLFMAAHDGEYRRVFDMNDTDILQKYLRGEELEADFTSGSVLMSVDGLPIGFANASNGRLKNKLPKGLRAF